MDVLFISIRYVIPVIVKQIIIDMIVRIVVTNGRIKRMKKCPLCKGIIIPVQECQECGETFATLKDTEKARIEKNDT